MLYSATPGSNSINRIDPDSGAVLASFAPPARPAEASGLAFSGTDLYYLSGTSVYVLDPVTGSVLNNFATPEGQGLGYGSTRFGPTLFVSVRHTGEVRLLDPATGALRTSYQVAAIGGMDFNSATGTLFLNDSATIREIDPDTGASINSFPIIGRQDGIGFVGGRLFTAMETGGMIWERDPKTGAVLNSYLSPGGLAVGLAGTPVPEPSTAALLVAAIGLVGTSARPRKAAFRG